MKKESAPPKHPKTDAPGKAPGKTPAKVPDADLEYEDTTHDDDNVQQSSSSDTSVPPDTR
ncbi:hypothetical protein WKW77_19870 [Variovorax ureilyticus]|uniref:Sigma-like protein n=1 Tax=Variovorax ureilyticus TaxID=1836198 RepID=A0ABU8VIQ8_9BURK